MFSIIILNKPIAVLLKAKGSLELVGFSLIPKKPTNVSILSMIDTAGSGKTTTVQTTTTTTGY